MIMSLLLRHGTPFPVGRVIAMLWEETYLFSHSERLEARTLLSATLEKHTLLVKGTAGDDVITLTLESTDGNAYKPSVSCSSQRDRDALLFLRWIHLPNQCESTRGERHDPNRLAILRHG